MAQETTTENKSKLELRKRFNDAFITMFPLAMIFLMILFILRIYEIFAASAIKQGGLKFEGMGFLYDLMLVLVFSGFMVIPFFIIHLVKPKIARIVYVVLMVLVLLMDYGLVGYFLNTNLLLGSDFFGYSWSDIKQTLGASNSVGILSILPFFIIIGLAIFLPLKIQKIKAPIYVSSGFFIAAIISLFFLNWTTDDRAYAKPIYGNYENNKFSWFAKGAWDHWFPELTDDMYNEFYYTANDEDSAAGKYFTNNYISDEYPFLHEETGRDVLGNFFNTGSERPNIVFIVEESLGRGYSGPDALQGSFTPFLDSLMDHSIYFDNFLSSAGRTFGFMPSIFASAPFASNGFLDLDTKMPTHTSMINILKQNGYYTSFYYGGDAHFDNMDVFLRKNNIDRIIQGKDYGAGYSKLPANDGGFTWGYGDKDLFRKMLDVNKTPVNKPRLDIFMTVANHSPFKIPNQQYYLNLFETMLKGMKFTEEQKTDFRQYAKNYSTVLYADDAIRQFINAYKDRPDFEITIFIITGDHRMPEIPIITKIDRYRVPFIIYSPMLKRTARIKSVSTHLDVTPTILAFMKNNYGVSLPRYASWVSTGIDTFSGFRNMHSVALMPVKGNLDDYLDHDYFVDGTQLFKIDPSMDITSQPSDDFKQKELKMKFTDYKERNKKAIAGNKLFPDSLMKINIVATPIVKKEEKKDKKKK